MVVAGAEDEDDWEGGEAEPGSATGARPSAASSDSLASADLTFSRVQTLWYAAAVAAGGGFRLWDEAESHGGERLRPWR